MIADRKEGSPCWQSTSPNSFLVAVADMIFIAFFFLLWLGEYTDFNQDSPPFVSQQLDLLHDSIALILQAQFASLTSTQKIGIRGKVIGLGCSRDQYLCPVTAIIQGVLYLQLNSAPPDIPLARLFNSNSHITTSVFTSTLLHAISLLGPGLGFLKFDISSCCLSSLGAMALRLDHIDTGIIR
ncbi:hypothetical protein ACHAW6_003789 [Cyclotella cf. meneghiniana]